jgi:hypothetical protein
MYKNNVNLSVIGSRSFNDYDLLSKTLTDLISEYNLNIVKFVSGGAKGADILGEKWADNNNIEKLIFLPDWKKFGKKAGFIRNEDIIANSDIVVSFWDGSSKGTKHSMGLAKKQNKKLITIKFG